MVPGPQEITFPVRPRADAYVLLTESRIFKEDVDKMVELLTSEYQKINPGKPTIECC